MYTTPFGPIVDGVVIPDNPLTTLSHYKTFAKYDVLFGLTESEAFHLFPASLGMLDAALYALVFLYFNQTWLNWLTRRFFQVRFSKSTYCFVYSTVFSSRTDSTETFFRAPAARQILFCFDFGFGILGSSESELGFYFIFSGHIKSLFIFSVLTSFSLNFNFAVKSNLFIFSILTSFSFNFNLFP